MKVSALLAALIVVGLFGTVACGDDDAAEPRVTCKYEFETVSCGNCVNSKCCAQLSACKSTCVQLNDCMITNDTRCEESETEEQSKACFTQHCGANISEWDRVRAIDVCMHDECADECEITVE